MAACARDEVASLKLRHVRLDDRGAILFVDGKTGERQVRLTDAVPDLLKWLEVHPKRNDPNAPLFPSSRKRNGELAHLDPKSYWMPDESSRRARRGCQLTSGSSRERSEGHAGVGR